MLNVVSRKPYQWTYISTQWRHIGHSEDIQQQYIKKILCCLCVDEKKSELVLENVCHDLS